jgi:predicted nucleic acid-binding protein
MNGVRVNYFRKQFTLTTMAVIAASALSRQLILVPSNEKEFRRVSKLKVENWL